LFKVQVIDKPLEQKGLGLKLPIALGKAVHQQVANSIMLLGNLEEVLSVEQDTHVKDVVLKHVYEVSLLELEIELLLVDHEAHQLQFPFYRKEKENLSVLLGLDVALLVVLAHDLSDGVGAPLAVEHHVEEVHELDDAVFVYALGRGACKAHVVYFGRGEVKLDLVSNALLEKAL
jgi:hypothetical protein